MRFQVVCDCPVPVRLARVILPSLRATGATLESCYRGTDPAGVKILHRFGKETQEELYAGWEDHRPGFNPANPPGFSTHELRSDGEAYRTVARGKPLAWWQCGMDIDDGHVDAFIAHLRERGVSAFRPYSAGTERHHVNLRVRPPLRLWLPV